MRFAKEPTRVCSDFGDWLQVGGDDSSVEKCVEFVRVVTKCAGANPRSGHLRTYFIESRSLEPAMHWPRVQSFRNGLPAGSMLWKRR